MRVLLLGAGGMLAHDIADTVPDGVELFPHTRADTDVTAERDLIAAVLDARPDVVVNCAAYTGVDRAESERTLARSVNGEAVGALGRLIARSGIGCAVVHFSSDYVFSGRERRPCREDDNCEPLGAYGESKLLGETLLAASGAEYLIVRTQWLFGMHGKSFPRTMWERARDGRDTRVVNDQHGRPTCTRDLAEAVWLLIAEKIHNRQRRIGEILHVANTGITTWYEVARRIFDEARQPALLGACSTADYPLPAPRPAYSVLDTSRFEKLAKPLPTWDEALKRFISQLKSETIS